MLAAIVSVSGLSLSDAEKRWLEQYNPVGVCLFARNISNTVQLQTLTNEIRQTVGRDDILIAVDQEGGRVRRLSGDWAHPLVSQYVLGQLEEDISVYQAALICEDLHKNGINMNFAPVLDIAYPTTHPVLKSRCFGNNEQKTALLGKAMIKTYLEHGICPCIKHMPGHGRAENDPHLGLPVLNYSLKELAKDFYPFINNNTCPAGMTAHILVSEVDDKLPVTMSKKAIDYLIRGVIGFDGLLISDAVDMKALSGTLEEKTRGIIAAGCDVLCYCGGKIEDLEVLSASCPQLNERGKERLLAVSEVVKQSWKPLNPDVEAEYYRVSGQIEEYDERYDATEVLNRMQP